MARLTKRCFSKILEINSKVRKRTLRINNAQQVTQGTFKDLLYNVEEEEQFKILCDLAAGKTTLAEWRKNKKVNHCLLLLTSAFVTEYYNHPLNNLTGMTVDSLGCSFNSG